MSTLGQYYPDNLIVGGGPTPTVAVVLASGDNLKRGSVLGKVRYAVPTTGTVSGTGNGTMTIVKGGRRTKQGTYTATVTDVLATGAVVFSVTNPDGDYLGNCSVGPATSETVKFASEEICFLITNGSTDFVAADAFTVAVTSYVPTTATVTGTGNGTMPQIEIRREAVAGVYLATCDLAIANGGRFNVTNPAGDRVGYAYASKRAGTGDGTITEIKAGPRFNRAGPYLISCTVAATHGGTFSVTNPDGTVIGTVTLPGTTGTSATFWHEEISFKITDGATDFLTNFVATVYPFESEHLAFVIWDGSTDFIVTDYFSITVAITAGRVRLVNRENVDGSQYPYAVLADDCDASSAATRTVAYLKGEFDARALYFGGNETLEDYRKDLIEAGIIPVASSRQPEVGA